MSRKKMFSLVVCILLVFAMVGCSQGGTASKASSAATPEAKGSSSAASVAAPSSDESTGEDLKIAVCIPGSINDGGFATNGYEGAKRLAEELGAEFSYSELKSDSDIADALMDYGDRGYDIVFAHNYSYQDACKEIAPDYPDTVFVTTGGTVVEDNITPIYLQTEHISFLQGAMAAAWSESGKVGSIGSQEFPAISKTVETFAQGAKYVNPDIEVVVTYLGTESDVGKGYEAALAMINNGVDFLFVNANAAGQGCFQAADANKDKVLVFGTNGINAPDYPDVIVADSVPDFYESFKIVANDVVNGNFTPGEYFFGADSGGVKNVWNEKFEADVPKEVLEVYEEVLQGLSDGSIVPDIGTY